MSALATAPTNPNRALVGMSDGIILRNIAALSADSTTNWPSVTPRSGYVSSVAFDPTNADVAYATYATFGGGAHVWKSTDGGATWSGIDGSGSTGLPDIPAHSVVVDPSNSMRLYVGTDLGVYATQDGGANWAVENTGFANVVTEKLAVNTIAGTSTLFAFTHGRGAFKVDLGVSVPGEPTNVTATAGDAEATVSWTAPTSDGGSPITNYIVTPYIGTTAQTATEVGNVFQTTITGLTNGTEYTFTVKAKNAVGEGPESPASNAVTPHAPEGIAVADFDGDGDTDFSVWRPVGGTWYAFGGLTEQWGVSDDVPVPGQYDADAATDVGVWRPSTGTWFVHSGATQQWGVSTDIPVPGDYDPDGDTEFAVWRPVGGTWYVHGGATQQWGVSTDIPVPGDYDGDGDDDFAVWRPSTGTWFVQGGVTQQWGVSTDVPVPGQYDADPATEIAVWRPSSGTWYVQGGATQQWGVSSDIPVPGQYDADPATELAVWRPSTGTWYVHGGVTQQWGISSDRPLPISPAIARLLFP